jgi:hypothetical protein
LCGKRGSGHYSACIAIRERRAGHRRYLGRVLLP